MRGEDFTTEALRSQRFTKEEMGEWVNEDTSRLAPLFPDTHIPIYLYPLSTLYPFA